MEKCLWGDRSLRDFLWAWFKRSTSFLAGPVNTTGRNKEVNIPEEHRERTDDGKKSKLAKRKKVAKNIVEGRAGEKSAIS